MHLLTTTLLTLSLLGPGPRPAAVDPRPAHPVATFSIVACDTLAREWGVAVASRFLAVGSVVPWAKAGVGAIATQAYANTSLGPLGLGRLESGLDAARTLRELLDADGEPELRQIGVVDREGVSATHTGKRCLPFAGGIAGPGFAIQGNSLASESVLAAMSDAFIASGGRPLAERLLAALEAGDKAGGDARGRQAAALLVVKDRGGYGGFNDRFVDLRVDDAPAPVVELRRLYELHARTFLPLVHARLGDEALRNGDRATATRNFELAVKYFRDAIRSDPDDAESRNGLAWFFVRHRLNLDEAQQLAEEAFRLRPESWQALDTLAEISYVRGKFDDAESLARRAVELNPASLYLQQQLVRFRDAREGEEGGS